MKQAVWVIYYHLMPSNYEPRHELCPKELTTWCKFNIAIVDDKEYDHDHHTHLPEIIMSEIKSIIKDLADPKLLTKCLTGKT